MSDRALYNDILFSGSRRFAVCTVDPKSGSFSQYASVLYLKVCLVCFSVNAGSSCKFLSGKELWEDEIASLNMLFICALLLCCCGIAIENSGQTMRQSRIGLCCCLVKD